MTDTPETDLEDDLYVECASSCIVKESTGEIFTGDFVPAEFARRLERERDQLRAINAELLESLEEVLNDWQYGYLASKYECTSYDIARELLTKVKKEKP